MRHPLHLIAVIGTAVLLSAPATDAQERSRFEAGGYVKSLLVLTTPTSGESLTDYLAHLRLNTAWYPSDVLTAIMELRFRAYTGSSVEQTPAFARGLQNRSLAWNLDRIFWSGRRSVGYGEVDRLALAWSPPGALVTLGRQRIAWGTNLVWNPIDVFNPRSVLDFDYEERPPVDGVRVQWYTGPVSKVEGAVKVGRGPRDVIAAGMWSFNVRGFDLRLCAGGGEERSFVGGGWAGEIFGGGFRGEILGSPRGGPYWSTSAAVSGDYTFPNTLYLHTEFLMNSEGVRVDAAAFRPVALQRGLLSPARFSIYQEIAFDVTPLVRGTLFAILNPDDGSSVVVPSISWNAAENLDVMGLLIYSRGDEGTEYGDYGRILFLRLRYSY